MEMDNNYSTNNAAKDPELWEVAKRRAAFKRSLIVYLVVNAFLVAIWYYTSGTRNYFWPVWPLMGWGIGLVFQYLAAYRSNSFFSVEKEYQKLKNNL